MVVRDVQQPHGLAIRGRVGAGLLIREFERMDAAACAELLRDQPWFETAAGIVHRIGALPERAHRGTWVAEGDSEIVGWAEAEFEWSSDVDDVAETWAFVRPDHRRRGLGTVLHDRAVEHALAHGARELRSGSWEDVGHRFLEQRGYRRSREERMSAVDPRTVDTSAFEPALPDGFRVVPLAELRGRERDVHTLYTEAAADMPADHPQTNLPFEEWLVETLGIPELSWEGSVVVLAGETPAALAFINVDLERRRAEHELTGTARAFRRRGLARAAKLATIRWCAEHGIERLATGNDATNAGMLAINRALGYEPWVTWVEYVREA